MTNTALIAADRGTDKSTGRGLGITRLMTELQLLMKELDVLDDAPEVVVESQIKAVEDQYCDRSRALENRHRSGLGRIERLFLGPKRQTIALQYLSQDRDAEIAKVARMHSMIEASHHQKLQQRAQTVFNQWIKVAPPRKGEIPKIQRALRPPQQFNAKPS